ncbi:MAG: class I SAM-dependent methyltransferase [Candidatus Handelsmanbacteria bacterium]|nr:class I SAM-dependent methyltransferase [Candidatus Handelsmanbacteria bacterium]
METQLAGAQNQDFRTIPRLWKVTKGIRALDLGAGLGLYSAALARQDAWVVGVDLELGHIAGARKEAQGRKLFWVRGDAAHLPFRPESFGLVVSVEMLSHLAPPDRGRALAEIGRVVREGGEVWLTLHNPVRLALGQWLRGRRSRQVYETANLPVWPSTPGQALGMVHGCGLQGQGGIRYLNYHSRFTFAWQRRHPWLARLLCLGEDLLARLPLLRRLGITFMLQATKAAGKPEQKAEEVICP